MYVKSKQYIKLLFVLLLLQCEIRFVAKCRILIYALLGGNFNHKNGGQGKSLTFCRSGLSSQCTPARASCLSAGSTLGWTHKQITREIC